MKRILLSFALFVLSALLTPLYSGEIPNPNKTNLPLGPSHSADVGHFDDQFTLRKKSPHGALLDRSYSPYSTKSLGYGRGWAPAYGLSLQEKKDRVTLLSPHGEPLLNFRRPLSSSKRGTRYTSPAIRLNSYESRLPLPVHLSKTPSAFVLKVPGGAQYRFSSQGRLQELNSPSGREKLHYRSDGLLERITDDKGKAITLQYSPKNGQVSSITSPVGKSEFRYSGKGDLEYAYHPDKRYDSYGYEKRKLVRYTSGKEGQKPSYTAHFTYAASDSGRVSKIKTGDGTLRKFKYLKRGMEVRDEKGLLYRVKHQGKKILAESPQGKSEFTFNKKNQITEIRIIPKGKEPYGVKVHYTPKGHIARAESYGKGGKDSLAFGYDGYGRLSGIQGDTSGVRFEYPRSGAGMVASLDKKKLNYTHFGSFLLFALFVSR